MIRLSRLAALIAGATLLAGCEINDLSDTPAPMGRFLLGHNIALTADPVQVGPLSRKVEDATWVPVIRKAVNDRFSRYDGDQYIHVSTVVLGYILAQPGLPVVAAPKSALIVDVYAYSDADGGKPLTEEPERFTVFEEGGGDVLVGSGLTRSAEEQMESLAKSYSLRLQQWFEEHPEWFGDAALMDPATTSTGRPIQPLTPQAPRS